FFAKDVYDTGDGARDTYNLFSEGRYTAGLFSAATTALSVVGLKASTPQVWHDSMELADGGVALLNKSGYHISPTAFNTAGPLGVIQRNAPKGTMTPDQRALKELVDETTLGGRRPLTTNQAETVLDWADEVGYPGV